MIACSGVFLEAVSSKESINPLGKYTLKVEAINRGTATIILSKIATSNGLILYSKKTALLPNESKNLELEVTSQNKAPSTAYWLKSKGSLGMYNAPQELIGLPQTPAAQQITCTLIVNNTPVQIVRDVVYKLNDPVDGEVYRPFNVLPKVSASIAEKVLVFADENTQRVAVHLRAGKDNLEGTLQLNAPKGWVVSSPQLFTLERQGETTTLWFTVTPPKNQSQGYLRPLIQIGDTYYDKELINIDYKYFAGSKDPIEIINKYRQRGYSLPLNDSEKIRFTSYSAKVEKWKILYGNYDYRNKNSINKIFGYLSKNSDFFKPRLVLAEYYTDLKPVDLINVYKNDNQIDTILNNKQLIIKTYPILKNDFDNIIKVCNLEVINKYGYINYIKKWYFDAIFENTKFIE